MKNFACYDEAKDLKDFLLNIENLKYENITYKNTNLINDIWSSILYMCDYDRRFNNTQIKKGSIYTLDNNMNTNKVFCDISGYGIMNSTILAVSRIERILKEKNKELKENVKNVMNDIIENNVKLDNEFKLDVLMNSYLIILDAISENEKREVSAINIVNGKKNINLSFINIIFQKEDNEDNDHIIKSPSYLVLLYHKMFEKIIDSPWYIDSKRKMPKKYSFNYIKRLFFEEVKDVDGDKESNIVRPYIADMITGFTLVSNSFSEESLLENLNGRIITDEIIRKSKIDRALMQIKEILLNMQKKEFRLQEPSTIEMKEKEIFKILNINIDDIILGSSKIMKKIECFIVDTNTKKNVSKIISELKKNNISYEKIKMIELIYNSELNINEKIEFIEDIICAVDNASEIYDIIYSSDSIDIKLLKFERILNIDENADIVELNNICKNIEFSSKILAVSSRKKIIGVCKKNNLSLYDFNYELFNYNFKYIVRCFILKLYKHYANKYDADDNRQYREILKKMKIELEKYLSNASYNKSVEDDITRMNELVGDVGEIRNKRAGIYSFLQKSAIDGIINNEDLKINFFRD